MRLEFKHGAATRRRYYVCSVDTHVTTLPTQKSEKFIYLVFEFCAGGDLSRLIQSQGPFSEAQCRAMLRQLGACLDAMSIRLDCCIIMMFMCESQQRGSSSCGATT